LQVTKGDEVLPATRCPGYEADMKNKCAISDEAENNVVAKTVPEPPKEYIRKNNEPETDDVPVDDTPVVETVKNNEGITTKITFMSGATLSKNNGELYYKFECTEERIITPEMNVAEEREKLWATINAEIDRQLEDVAKS
jgi:hypothetical protein